MRVLPEALSLLSTRQDPSDLGVHRTKEEPLGMEWLFSEYSLSLFKRIGLSPFTPDVAGIAEDDGDIVVWFKDHTEQRYPNK